MALDPAALAAALKNLTPAQLQAFGLQPATTGAPAEASLQSHTPSALAQMALNGAIGAVRTMMAFCQTVTQPPELTAFGDEAVTLAMDFIPAAARSEAGALADAIIAKEAPAASAFLHTALAVAEARIDAVLKSIL